LLVFFTPRRLRALVALVLAIALSCVGKGAQYTQLWLFSSRRL
jgi:hypothetical protein